MYHKNTVVGKYILTLCRPRMRIPLGNQSITGTMRLAQCINNIFSGIYAFNAIRDSVEKNKLSPR